MKVGPIHRALQGLKVRQKDGSTTIAGKKARVILTSAKGKTFTQAEARRLAEYDRLVFVCGRYEGVDERVAEYLIDEELSIGNYVLTGGELAAMIMTDAVARLRPGVLGKEASLETESHTIEGVLEHGHYTRPEVYSPKKGVAWGVPEVLLSGNHKKIDEWRKKGME